MSFESATEWNKIVTCKHGLHASNYYFFTRSAKQMEKLFPSPGLLQATFQIV